jgi:hypothetical protein
MNNFYDPHIVALITYLDEHGQRRVKPPYKNRRAYARLVLFETPEYITPLPENSQGKSVVVSFIGKTAFRYRVEAAAGSITIFGAPLGTYFEIIVIDPAPIPYSPKDPLWDSLSDESKRAFIIVWSDLVCYSEFSGTVDGEWDLDDMAKRKFIGWRNNYANIKVRL